ncbi:hypothetical protein BCR33DRAFT_852345 [Rhizoclosmatium globosum]|uniref:DDHD domain-containing protein n=1 Tax=Rhizoclosmatium globosum TaxID=329046 RepID=A0A1Y2C4W6_9FUNG|nr:hypothetical protein BCR33DRAFT_852345 [Rhizoclosmatium globosum]|eukprot:ORY41365.1 hypothetical protein BCR33DRAFT_852345 [Rhizoclosmatium globosum]
MADPLTPPAAVVRWFHATDAPKADHSPFKIIDPSESASSSSLTYPCSGSGSSIAPRAKAPTQWSAFSYRDSMNIEEKYQAMLLDPNSTDVLVLVNEDLLYEVNVAKKEVYPVYWHGPTHHIQRGTGSHPQTEQNSSPATTTSPNNSKTATKIQTLVTQTTNPLPLPSTTPTHVSSSTTTPTHQYPPRHTTIPVPTHKRQAQIINDQLSSKLTRAVMSQLTRTEAQAWGTKVWRGWDEVERVVKKSQAVAGATGSGVGAGVSKEGAGGGSRRSSVAMAGAMAGTGVEGSGSSLGDVSGGGEGGSGGGGGLSAKSSKESLGGEEERWRDEDNVTQDRQIDHLVLVIHGVGQKLGERVETVDFAKDCTSLRQAIKQSSKLYFTPGATTPVGGNSTPKEKPASTPSSRKPVLQNMPEHGGVQVLPVQWRQKIEFGKRKDPKKSNTPQTDAEKKAEEEEEARRKEQEVHIDDITLEGVQSIRYLVSDIVLDVLLYMTPKYRQEMVNHVVDEMNRIYDAYKLRNPNFNGRVSVYGHSLGSLLAFDILCNQAYGETEPTPTEAHNLAHTQRRFNGLMEKAEIQYKTLHFKVDKFFAVDRLLVSSSSSKETNSVAGPFHPFQTLPLHHALQSTTSSIHMIPLQKPVPIQYNKGGIRGAITGISDLSTGIMSRGFNMISGLWITSPNPQAGVMNIPSAGAASSSVGVPALGAPVASPGSPKKDGKDERVREKPPIANVRALNPRGRLDYVLQEGVLENPYLSSLSSHMTYWPDHDVAVFMLRELHS